MCVYVCSGQNPQRWEIVIVERFVYAIQINCDCTLFAYTKCKHPITLSNFDLFLLTASFATPERSVYGREAFPLYHLSHKIGCTNL